MVSKLEQLGLGLFGLGLVALPLPFEIRGISLTNLFNLAAFVCVLPQGRALLGGQRLWLASVALVCLLGVRSPTSLSGFIGLALTGFLTGVFTRRAGPDRVALYWMTGAAVAVLAGLGGFFLALAGFETSFVQRYPGFPYFGDFPRVLATFANPTALNTYLLAGILLAAAGLPRMDGKGAAFLRLVNAPLAVAVGLLSLSKIVLFSVGGWLWRRARILAALAWAAALLLPLGVFTAHSPATTAPGFGGIFPERAVVVFEEKLWWVPTNYLLAKEAATKVFLTRPVLGVGLGGFPEATAQLIATAQLPAGLAGFNPHSTYFGIAAEGGILGLGALGAWIALLVCLLKRPAIDPAHHAALVAFWLTFSLVAVHSDVLRLPVFWFAIGFTQRVYENA